MRLSASVLVSDAETDFDSFAFGAQGSVGDGDEFNETQETVANMALDVPLDAPPDLEAFVDRVKQAAVSND